MARPKSSYKQTKVREDWGEEADHRYQGFVRWISGYVEVRGWDDGVMLTCRQRNSTSISAMFETLASRIHQTTTSCETSSRKLLETRTNSKMASTTG